MKRLLITGAIGLFFVALSSCGGGHICPAYGGKADYSKYKVEHNQKVQMIQELAAATK